MISKKNKANLTQDLAERAKDYFRFLKEGELIEAKVIDKGRKTIYFDLGPYGTGICYKSEFFDLPQDMKDTEKDSQILVKVIRIENEEGLVEVSLKRAGQERNWDYIKDKFDKEEDLLVKIIGANRGGLLTRVRGIDAFLPVSQLKKDHYPNVGGDGDRILKELKNFIGQDINVKIIDIEKANRKLILSEKAEELKKMQARIGKYSVDDIIEGEICGIVDYGAFIKFDDSLEGLVHISEIDWQLIEDPRDYLKIGERVKAKIIALKDNQISLSLRALKKDPWAELDKKYHKGDIVKGTVVRVSPYGIFVKLNKYIQGLVPISKIHETKEGKIPFETGKTYEFKIFSLDPRRHRMALVPAK